MLLRMLNGCCVGLYNTKNFEGTENPVHIMCYITYMEKWNVRHIFCKERDEDAYRISVRNLKGRDHLRDEVLSWVIILNLILKK
jgi:hypothetical protein